jgi:hypothetical protein
MDGDEVIFKAILEPLIVDTVTEGLKKQRIDGVDAIDDVEVGMWLAREPGAGSGEQGAGIKRAESRDCRKKSRNR